MTYKRRSRKNINRLFPSLIVAFSLLSLLVSLPLPVKAYPTTYYVDAINGDDSNAGTSALTAWKTISRVNSSAFSPGDQILFQKGETWREQLIAPSSGTPGNLITFGSYGSGNKPIISGADVVSSWTVQNNLTSGTYYFADGFESGSTSAWSHVNGSNLIDNTQSRSGTYSFRAKAPMDAVGQNVSGYHKELWLSFSFRIADSNWTAKHAIYRNDASIADYTHLGVDANGKVYLDIDGTTYASTQAVDYQTWVDIRIHVNNLSSGGTAQVWYKTAAQADFTNIIDLTGLSLNGADIVTNYLLISDSGIEVNYDNYRLSYTGFGSPVYKASVSWTARAVWNDGTAVAQRTFGTDAFETALSASANQWFLDGPDDSLYLAADPAGHAIEVGRRDYAIYDGTAGYVEINGLDARGGNAFWGGAIEIRGRAGPWTVTNCAVTRTGNIGIMIDNDDSEISNCTVSYTGGSGIFYYRDATRGRIAGNDVSYSRVPGVLTDLSGGAGIYLWGNSATIERNNIHHNSWYGLYIEGRPSIGISADNNVIRYNTFHDNGQGPTYGDVVNGAEIYDSGGDNEQFYYNVIYNGSPVYAAGIWLDYGSQNNQVYNNTIYNMMGSTSGDCLKLEDGPEGGPTQNNIYKNNILASCKLLLEVWDTIDDDLQGNVFTNNLYYLGSGSYAVYDGRPSYRGYKTLAGWQASPGAPDAHSISADPEFVNAANNDYHLQSSSPAINAGASVGLTSDKDGVPVPPGSAPDIGAYEFSEGQVPPSSVLNKAVYLPLLSHRYNGW